jgi:CheY-like chemotaxis protein
LQERIVAILVELGGTPGETVRLGGLAEVWLGSGEPDDADQLGRWGERERAHRQVPHILIVEDELFIAWHLEDIVQSMNHHVCAISARGEDAVAKASELTPDLVLMDVNLAGKMDGIEAARRIAEAQRVPVIFITAYGDRGTLDRIEHAVPGSTVLQKPIAAETLRLAVTAALGPRAN